MKLTVPAIRVVEPVRNDDADETKELLDAIDALLAESMAEAPDARDGEAPASVDGACTRPLGSSRVGQDARSLPPPPERRKLQRRRPKGPVGRR